MLNFFLKYKEDNGIAYLLNPKVACTTIQNSLLEGKVENVHDIKNFPPYYDISAPIFTVVRNPFTRIVSAYLDKVKSKKDLVVWEKFCESIDVECNYDISFEEFVDILFKHPNLKEADKHFRPQIHNFHGITPSFIGYIEDMDSVERFLLAFGVVLLNKIPHKTDTESEKYTLLENQEIIDKIVDIYECDFDAFGYSKSPFSSFDRHPIVQLKFVPEHILEKNHSKDEYLADIYRDAADFLKEHRPHLAWKLISMASRIRPNGPVIKDIKNKLENSLFG